jgi:hypothetical protein
MEPSDTIELAATPLPRSTTMTLRHIVLAISLSLFALAGCHAGAHVGVGEKTPTPATQPGSPS